MCKFCYLRMLMLLCFSTSLPFTLEAHASSKSERHQDILNFNSNQQEEKRNNKKGKQPDQQVEVKKVPKAKKQNAPTKVRMNAKIKPKIVRPKIKKH